MTRATIAPRTGVVRLHRFLTTFPFRNRTAHAYRYCVPQTVSNNTPVLRALRRLVFSRWTRPCYHDRGRCQRAKSRALTFSTTFRGGTVDGGVITRTPVSVRSITFCAFCLQFGRDVYTHAAYVFRDDIYRSFLKQSAKRLRFIKTLNICKTFTIPIFIRDEEVSKNRFIVYITVGAIKRVSQTPNIFQRDIVFVVKKIEKTGLRTIAGTTVNNALNNNYSVKYESIMSCRLIVRHYLKKGRSLS